MKKIEKVLYDYKNKVHLINDFNIQIQLIAKDVGNIKAISYEEKTQSTNKFSSCVENEIINKDKLIEKLEKEKELIQLEVDRIDNMLEILSDEDKKIIELRYFKKLKFNKIADILDRNEIALISKNTSILNKLSQFYYKNIM